MPQATQLLNAQTADFQGLLGATRDLLDGPLDGPRVDAYRAARAACLERTGPREADLLAALADSAPAEAVAAYRGVLEALVAEERRLAERAAAERAGLAQELAGLAAGRRALAGYRSPRGWADPRAVSRHV
jgi:hypothetical protein